MEFIRKYGWQVLWLIPVVLFFDATIRPMAEPDLFFYFALVEYYLKQGHWPTTDPFLYTLPNDPLMTAHQWLGYWLFYFPYKWFSWTGPIVFKTLLVSLFFAIPLVLFVRRRTPVPLYFVLVWTLEMYISHHRFRERVSVFGDLFVMLLFIALMFWRDRRWMWAGLPLAFLLWTQLHPSWPLGLVILGLFFVTRRPVEWKRYMLLSFGLCILAPLLNPLGLDGYFYPFEFSMNIEPYLRKHIVEWLPLTDLRIFSYRFLYVPFYTVVPFLLFRLWRQRKQVEVFEWAMFALAFALMVKSVRFGLVAQCLFLVMIVRAELRVPLVFAWPGWARWRGLLGRAQERKPKKRGTSPRQSAQQDSSHELDRLGIAGQFSGVLGPVLIGVISLGISAYKMYPTRSWEWTLDQRLRVETGYFPEAAVNFLSAMKLNMNILNSFGFGGYLAWRWQGDPKIFFHGFSTNFRFYETYYIDPQMNRDIFNMVIEKFNIGVGLISKLGNDNPLIMLFASRSDFQKIYEDPSAVIFVKRVPGVFK